MESVIETSGPTPRPQRRTLVAQCAMDLVLVMLWLLPPALAISVVFGFKAGSSGIVREDRWRFEAMPANDDSLLRWAATQGGVDDFRASRLENAHLLLHYKRSTAFGPAHPDWDSLGYRQAYLVSAPAIAGSPAMSSSVAAIMMVFTGLAAGGVAVTRMKRERRRGVALIGLAARPSPSWLPWVGLAFVSIVAFNATYFWLLHRMNLDQGIRDPAKDLLSHMSGWPLYLAIGYVALAGPFVEELLFRGCMLGRFQAQGYTMAGAVTSALFFSLSHGVLALLPAYFVIGLMCAWVYRRAGSLWPSIALHSLNNTCVIGVLVFAHML
jgi:membrane protease YdiL (CAAX protease family)